MVGLPRRHVNSVPNWVEVTMKDPGNQPRGAFETGQQQARSFAPGLSFFSRPVLASHLGQLEIGK
jgi:hypothetical protein